MAMDKHDKNTDGGYAWVILSACVFQQFLTDGIVKSLGLFYVKILEEFNESVSKTTMISGIMNGVYCLSIMPVMMILMKTFTTRKVVIVGALITAAGYSISCFAQNTAFLFFTISIMVGGGMSMILAPSICVLGTYFEKRRAMANGIAISGCSVGGLLWPGVYSYLLNTYGLRGGFLISGAILLHNVPIAGLLCPKDRNSNSLTDAKNNKHDLKSDEENEELFIKNKKDQDSVEYNKYIEHRSLRMHCSDEILFLRSDKKRFSASERDLIFSNSESENEGGESQNDREESQNDRGESLPYLFKHECGNTLPVSLSGTSLNTRECFKLREETVNLQHRCPTACIRLLNSTFILFAIANAFASIVASTFLAFLPLYATDNNIDNKNIVILVSLSGALDFVSKIISGFLADRPSIKTYHIIAFSQAVCGIAYHCNPIMTTLPGMVILSVLIGLFGGVQLVLMYTHIVQIVGLDLAPSALSITIFCQLPAFILGPLIFGLLRDATGDFRASFHVIGTLALFSAVLLMCEPLTLRSKR